jgi:SEC-C motif-containing protein
MPSTRGVSLLASSVVALLLFLFVPGSTALAAAKKKKGKPRSTASSSKGFGEAPLTFDQVVAGFPTRLGAPEDPCPCGQPKMNEQQQQPSRYADCCAPYHDDTKLAETPLRVLQTRYSAFYYRLIPYIIRTTHPTCRDYQKNNIAWAKDLHANGMFDSYDFVALQPGTAVAGAEDDEAFLDFTVRLRTRDTEAPTDTVVAETSRFLKVDGSWLYASGEVRSTEAGLTDLVLNP